MFETLLASVDIGSLLTGVVGALVGAGAVGWSKLGDLVATSKTTIDDAVYKALNDAIKKQVVKAEPEEE